MTTSPPIRLPAGVRDFLPRAAARRRAIAELLLSVFDRWGYQRIITPMFEHADVLERGLGEAGRASAIRFVEPGTGELVALRPDITPQVARLAATRMADVKGPLRLSYEGAVARLNGGSHGQKEILQAGVELIGADSPDGDAEALAVAAAALRSADVADIGLDVGHVALVRHAMDGISDDEVRAALTRALAKKDRAGVAEAAAKLPIRTRELLDALPTLFGSARKVLLRARKLALPSRVKRGLDTVEQVLKLSKSTIDPDIHGAITLDLGEVRGFQYYTGMRFAGYAAGYGEAVLRGGRYDELVGRYGREAHATGLAVDIEGVAQAQRAADVASPQYGGGLLVCGSPKATPRAADVAAGLRRSGLRTATDLGRRRSKKALFGYARSVGFDYVLLIEPAGVELLDMSVERPVGRPITRAAVNQAAAGDAEALLVALVQSRRS